jgi:hypothetical protein
VVYHISLILLLLNDPLQDSIPVQPTTEIGCSDTSYALNAQPAGISREHLMPSKSWQLLAFEVVSNPVPLYIEHLALII